MDYMICEHILNQTLQLSPALANNTTAVMSKAWWNYKEECTKLFGGGSKVSSYVEAYKQGLIEKVSLQTLVTLPKTDSNTPASSQSGQTATVVTVQQNVSWFDRPTTTTTVIYFGKWLLYLALLLFVWFLVYKFIRYLSIFFYDVLNAHRMVYLKVLQTRGDSKVDREANKELAKDMKEKISRMTQVYNNVYKLGQASFYESILAFLLRKPKITLTLSYESWQLEFIIGIYPEHQAIIEWALSAQFSDCSIEVCTRPQYFSKKYSEVGLLEPEKDIVYTIKTFKYMPDDPLNNLVDSVAKVSSEDTFHILMILKPLWDKHNKRVKYFADALYKKQKSKIDPTAWWKYIIFPWKIFQFFLNGPSKELLKNKDDEPSGMVRMIKAEEDAYQSMGEEASNHAFSTGVLLLTSSDQQENTEKNIDTVMGAYSIYEEQYLNSLVESNIKKDIFWRFFEPLWKFAVRFNLLSFFYTVHAFSVNALSSLFHLPDGIYNKSQIIRWMDYKALACPDNAPILDPKDDTGYIMSGIVAERFQGGKLSDILAKNTHPAVGKKIIQEDVYTPIEHYTQDDLADKEIVEKDWKKYVKTSQDKDVYGYKINKWGVLLWVNIYRNKYSPVYMKREDRMRHHYLIGKSGTGKSVLLQTLARQDIRNGDGCCVIDPHGDLVEDILEYIPKERAKDLVFFDAGNEDRPMWLNLYDIDNVDQADRTVNDATEIFLKMFWPEIFGPRIQEYFKYGSLTLLEDFDDKPTLLDVPRLFTDETYRDFKTKKVKNAVVKNFREKTYAAMGDREKQEIIPYFTSKFVSFNTNRLIRNIIGQTKSSIKFKEAMDSQKIILVSLSKGKIWEINAQLLGMILVSQIYNGAMARATMSKEERKDFYLYVDEFQNFVSWTFADILSEARKYRLALVMAHQYIAQLEAGKWLGDIGWWKNDVKAAVFGNCGTIQSFKIGAPDAEFLEKEYAPVLWAQDIIGISNYKTYLKLNIDNSTSRVFSLNAIYTQDYRNKKIAAILKEYSAKKYGRKREFVDAEISVRLWLWSETTEENLTPSVPEWSVSVVQSSSVPPEMVSPLSQNEIPSVPLSDTP